MDNCILRKPNARGTHYYDGEDYCYACASLVVCFCLQKQLSLNLQKMQCSHNRRVKKFVVSCAVAILLSLVMLMMGMMMMMRMMMVKIIVMLALL